MEFDIETTLGKLQKAWKDDLPETQKSIFDEAVKELLTTKDHHHLCLLMTYCLSDMASLRKHVLKTTEEVIKMTEQDGNKMMTALYHLIAGKAIDIVSYDCTKSKDHYKKALEDPAFLASVHLDDYSWLKKGNDSILFGDDLLSFIGIESGCFDVLYDYYKNTDNRAATCYSQIQMILNDDSANEEVDEIDEEDDEYEEKDEEEELKDEEKYEKLSAVINEFGDLPVVCLAVKYIVKNNLIPKPENVFEKSDNQYVERKYLYAKSFVDKFAEDKYTRELESVMKKMECPRFGTSYFDETIAPNRPFTIDVETRNNPRLTISVYPTDLTGEDVLRQSKSDLNKENPHVSSSPIYSKTYRYENEKPYITTKTQIEVEGLPLGIYLMELKSNNGVTDEKLLHVSGITAIAECLPDDRMRIVVVDNMTGQPVRKAMVDILNWNNKVTETLFCNIKGEAVYQFHNTKPRSILPYTRTDRFCNVERLWNLDNYNYNKEKAEDVTEILTDRAIYRPGQTIHAAIVQYHMDENKFVKTICKNTHVELSKQYENCLKRKKIQTDDLGVAHCDFVIPEDIETGDYTLSCDGGRKTIKIEEYKRPSFEVKMEEYGKPYKNGDNIELEGVACSYAGVPVVNSKVSYRVKRTMAWWWLCLRPYWDMAYWYERYMDKEYYEGEGITDENGRFKIRVPMSLQNSSQDGIFMNIIVEADVIDSTGEMQTGRMTLPLSDKEYYTHIQMEDKKELSDPISFMFVAKNATGQDMDKEFQYWVGDSEEVLTASSNQTVTLPALETGKHVLHVKSADEEQTHDFVVFDKYGERTPSQTNKWSYQSAKVFPENGDDVILQIGCSEENTYILYNLFSGDKLLESGAGYATSGMINRHISYKEEYGNALLISYAWVRDKQLQTQNFTITKPVPKRELHLSWKTFRDRVTPGTREKWALSVTDSDGNNVTANVIATLYDKSLDVLAPNRWNGFGPVLRWNTPTARWIFQMNKTSLYDCVDFEAVSAPYDFNSFKHKIPLASRECLYDCACCCGSAPSGDYLRGSMNDDDDYTGSAEMEPPVIGNENETQELHLRSDMSETAFFMPMLRTNNDGEVVMEFTLPDCLTTWKFQAVAHTSQMYHSYIEGEAVARKQVMVQPNMPRFVRVGDHTTISAKVTNCSGKAITGKMVFELLDACDEQVIFSESKPFTLDDNATSSESFRFTPDEEVKDYICKVYAVGDGFSDGEQHSLQVLPNKTEVTVTHVISQDGAGTVSINTAALLPDGSTRRQLSLQYTNNPIWLAIQALPAMTDPDSKNAISVSVSLYCTLLTIHLQNAVRKYGEGLGSSQENIEWLTNKLVCKLQKLQGHGGGFKWYRDMPESFYMTTEVLMHLCRLQKYTGGLDKVEGIVKKAFLFSDQEMCSQVRDLQKREKEGKEVSFPAFSMLQHLYNSAITGRVLTGEAKASYDYLLQLLMKDIHRQTIREKAMTAVILEYSGFHERAKVYAESLRQYTKLDDERGRTFDTPRASYSWYSYKIPTHVAGMEALYMLCPEDKTTLREMQKWLLQEKRTQMWETPIDSVNSVHALLLEADEYLSDKRPAEFLADGKELDVISRGDGGYVETTLEASTQTLSVIKHSKGLSWGAVFAQFLQPMSDVAASSSGMTIKREIITDKEELHVGDRIRVRLTYTCERNFDLVTVIDSKAACMEPIEQLSWSDSFKHVSPRDTETRYSYYGLAQGTHSIETEYYFDRPGVYEMGVATIVCTYAPEFRATCPSQKLYVND